MNDELEMFQYVENSDGNVGSTWACHPGLSNDSEVIFSLGWRSLQRVENRDSV